MEFDYAAERAKIAAAEDRAVRAASTPHLNAAIEAVANERGDFDGAAYFVVNAVREKALGNAREFRQHAEEAGRDQWWRKSDLEHAAKYEALAATLDEILNLLLRDTEVVRLRYGEKHAALNLKDAREALRRRGIA